jgi:hypothetical protein
MKKSSEPYRPETELVRQNKGANVTDLELPIAPDFISRRTPMVNAADSICPT